MNTKTIEAIPATMPAMRRVHLPEWDATISPALGAIQGNAHWIKKHSERVQNAANLLPSKPNFETRAYAELALAEAELKAALKSVEAAMERYQNLESAA